MIGTILIGLCVSGCQPDSFEIGDAAFVRRGLSIGGSAIEAADVDGDGDLDLVVGDERVTIMLGDGRGGWTIGSRVDAGPEPVDFSVADVNGDGLVDIMTANHDTRHVTLLIGRGGGAFEASRMAIGVDPHPHAVAAVDLDGDDVRDLVVDHRNGRGLLVLLGLGDARFQRPGALVDAGGDPYRGMAIGDVNSDGRPDIVTPNPREIGVLLNESASVLDFADPAMIRSTEPFALALADLDGDGHLDIVAASGEGSSSVHVYAGDGLGGFNERAGSPYRVARGAKSIAIGDFNGDGVQDAAVACYRSSRVFLFLGGAEVERGWIPACDHPWGMAAGDFNGDGRDDLVVAEDGGDDAFVFLSVGS